ncbi:MAG: response regulator [Treponema sp.]|nr:response regulator [Treponema sp.]
MENHNQQFFLNNILANTLHEIRTPIQTIIGALELLSDTSVNNEQTEYIRQIQFSADVLLSLANNVLDFSKIQTNQFKLESISYNLHNLVEQVTDLICIEAFNKGLDVITDIEQEVPQFVIGDPTRVQQILLNLLKNAVKFTSKGYIRCRLSLAEPENPVESEKKLYFEVIDTGIGISEENEKKVFNSFYQGDASISRKYGGTGLGLTICKSLAELMHGKIGIKTNPAGGSIFWFTIPLKVPESPENGKTSVLHDTGEAVLVIENNECTAKSLVYKIQKCGLKNITCVNSSKEALELLENDEAHGKMYSIVFINMLMGEIDGWHLASEIKQKGLCKNSKLYLCVPEGQMGAEAKMKLLNWFEGYLYKPVKQQKLFETLKIALSKTAESEEIHNGSRSVENTSLSDAEKAGTAKENQSAAASEQAVVHGLSILVAEDHPVNRKLIVAFLNKLGAKVTEAVDGNEAVKIYKTNSDIDMIFMDIQMPVKDGIQATDEIRSLGYRGIIIACTANNDFSTVDEYEKHGFNDTLIKPFKSSKIREILLKWQDFCIMPAELIPEDK